MSNTENTYTLEVYKTDKRTKSGERLVSKTDYDNVNMSMFLHTVKTTWPNSAGYRTEVHKTYVARKNFMSGENFQERYDTPYSCSPSSETYWSS